MKNFETVYILGAGAVGWPLAVHLVHAGRRVIVVRTSAGPHPSGPITMTIRGEAPAALTLPIESIPLADLPELRGVVVITVKSHANAGLAEQLARKPIAGPLVVMQNGLDVERPFLAADFPSVHRAVLYMTSQTVSPADVTFRSIASSPLGTLRGSPAELEHCVAHVHTPAFPFHAEPEIRRAIWKKTIVNAVFNSLCPLLDVDNGIFVREPAVRELARGIVEECAGLAHRVGIALPAEEILEQIRQISQGSGGVLISTLQDLRHGRPTEIESLNLALARLAAAQGLALPRTELLGEMILAKSQATLRPKHAPL